VVGRPRPSGLSKVPSQTLSVGLGTLAPHFRCLRCEHPFIRLQRRPSGSIVCPRRLVRRQRPRHPTPPLSRRCHSRPRRIRLRRAVGRGPGGQPACTMDPRHAQGSGGERTEDSSSSWGSLVGSARPTDPGCFWPVVLMLWGRVTRRHRAVTPGPVRSGIGVAHLEGTGHVTPRHAQGAAPWRTPATEPGLSSAAGNAPPHPVRLPSAPLLFARMVKGFGIGNIQGWVTNWRVPIVASTPPGAMTCHRVSPLLLQSGVLAVPLPPCHCRRATAAATVMNRLSTLGKDVRPENRDPGIAWAGVTPRSTRRQSRHDPRGIPSRVRAGARWLAVSLLFHRKVARGTSSADVDISSQGLTGGPCASEDGKVIGKEPAATSRRAMASRLLTSNARRLNTFTSWRPQCAT